MMQINDQLGQALIIKKAPRRVVCLVPSITELLCDLGLQEYIVGCTKFCIHPYLIRKSAVIIGGTKKFNFSKISSLCPDLIIANKEENSKNDVDRLKEQYQVFVSHVSTLEDIDVLLQKLGVIFNCNSISNNTFVKLRQMYTQQYDRVIKVAYLIWRNPYMSVGRDTFINTMLLTSGFENVYNDNLRYPETNIEEIVSRKPELLFLSSEPFPFTPKHQKEIQESLRDITVVLVNGEYFSWYGTRQLHLPNYISELRSRLK